MNSKSNPSAPSSSLIATLSSMGITLPDVAPAAANYVPYILQGPLLSISGQLPFIDGKQDFIGRLGEDMSIEQGQDAAKNCALNILAQLNAALQGDLSRLERCVKLGVFVNSTPDFTSQHLVANGASNFIGDVLGETGRHSRSAVGVPTLPFGVAVEIDALFMVKP